MPSEKTLFDWIMQTIGAEKDLAGQKILVTAGATAEKIEAAVKSAPDYRPGQPEILHAQTLEEAVRLAKRHTVPGDIVTLSPACAAFDQFKNFMVRGETYKTLVRAL